MSTVADDVRPEPELPPKPEKRRWPDLSVQVLIGMVLGILAGLFFGELIAPVQLLGEIFIALLQMTVLPYILISLIGGLGKLSYPEVRLLAVRGGRFVLLFWLIALFVIVAFTASFPSWESATFFSSSLVQIREPTDIVALYIPSNPFFSLSSSVIPAVVLFSLAIGLAVIGVPGKSSFLSNLDVLGEAIMRIAGFVARLAPIGVFALIAAAAGTLDVEALGRLQVYILAYIGAALLLSFWVLPGLVGVLTSIEPRRVLSAAQDALITAFATGSLLIVLPLMAERIKALLAEANTHSREADSAVDLVVPINFNLPNLGKLLSLAFVPFAGWFAGTTLTAEQFPLFLFSGLLSFFGEVVVALPFLLDLMRIPADMFQLFLAVDVFTGRFGTLLAGVHTVVLALLTAAAVSGNTRLRWAALWRYAVVSAGLGVSLFLGLRIFFEVVVPQEYRQYEKLVQMELLVDRVQATETKLEEAAPQPRGSDGSRLGAIQERGTLRVGYLPQSLPFMYRNEQAQQVGLEADLAHLLASEMNVELEFVQLPWEDFVQHLADGRVDIVLSGLFVTPQRALNLRFSEPYLNANIGLVVPDHERDRYASVAKLRALESVRFASLDLPYYTAFIRRNVPNAEVVIIDSPRRFFSAEAGEFDALIYSAEAGSAWTLVYPQFSVVVPKPKPLSAPIAVGLPLDAPRLYAYVDTWLQLQRESGVIDELHDYWILGEGAGRKHRRWSVLRDVLGWAE